MILAPDRSKLSKRHGATSVEEFRSQGYLNKAIVNYLTLLGWGPGDEREIFSLEETVKLFELEQMSKKAAVYDVKKINLDERPVSFQPAAGRNSARSRTVFCKIRPCNAGMA